MTTQTNATTRTVAVIAGSGAALAGYLGLGLSIWQIRPGLASQVIYLLSVGVAGLTVFAAHQRGIIARLQQEREILGLMVDQAQRIEDVLGRAAGPFLHLAEKPHSSGEHHFRRITEEYIIRGDDGSFNYTFDGECLALRSSSLTIKITGDRPCTAEALALCAADTDHQGRRLRCQVVADRPRCKVVEILFGNDLRTGDTFRIEFHCRWPGAFAGDRQDDYVFSPWGVHFSGGIDELSGRLVIDAALTDFLLTRFEDGEWVRTDDQPRETHSSRRRTELEWDSTDPRHVYQLAFQKTITG